MIPDHLTRHERGVLIAALRGYADGQKRKAKTAVGAQTRAIAGANEYVAASMLQELTAK